MNSMPRVNFTILFIWNFLYCHSNQMCSSMRRDFRVKVSYVHRWNSCKWTWNSNVIWQYCFLRTEQGISPAQHLLVKLLLFDVVEYKTTVILGNFSNSIWKFKIMWTQWGPSWHSAASPLTSIQKHAWSNRDNMMP